MRHLSVLSMVSTLLCYGMLRGSKLSNLKGHYLQFSGITYIYGVLQSGCWIMVPTLVIFWGIYFPFHYQRFKASGQLKRVHITAIVLAVALPAIPALALLKDGYHITHFAFCAGRNLNAFFYGFVLPFSILSGVITILMVLILWSILKVHYSV